MSSYTISLAVQMTSGPEVQPVDLSSPFVLRLAQQIGLLLTPDKSSARCNWNMFSHIEATTTFHDLIYPEAGTTEPSHDIKDFIVLFTSKSRKEEQRSGLSPIPKR